MKMNPNPRILLADDDKTVHKFMKEVLEQSGYNVASAYNGHEAREIYRQSRSDCGKIEMIITDLEMPVLDGFGLVHYVRKDSKIPIIMVSGRFELDSNLLGTAKELGVDLCLKKPFRIKELTDAVEMLSAHQAKY